MSPATTAGTLLAGRVRYEQPVDGYRTGIEPVFLAAAVPAHPGQRVLEGGTGAGAALLCLAVRVPGLCGLGVELDPATATVAARNMAGMPGLSVRTGALESLDGVAPFDHACANPPWHDPAGTPSPLAARRAALHAAHPGALALWCRALRRHLCPGGTLTLVLAARLADAAAEILARNGAGNIRRRALLPKEGRAPKIVLLHATAGTAGRSRELPPLVLHQPDGRYTAEADSVLRDGAALSWTG